MRKLIFCFAALAILPLSCGGGGGGHSVAPSGSAGSSDVTLMMKDCPPKGITSFRLEITDVYMISTNGSLVRVFPGSMTPPAETITINLVELDQMWSAVVSRVGFPPGNYKGMAFTAQSITAFNGNTQLTVLAESGFPATFFIFFDHTFNFRNLVSTTIFCDFDLGDSIEFVDANTIRIDPVMFCEIDPVTKRFEMNAATGRLISINLDIGTIQIQVSNAGYINATLDGATVFVMPDGSIVVGKQNVDESKIKVGTLVHYRAETNQQGVVRIVYIAFERESRQDFPLLVEAGLTQLLAPNEWRSCIMNVFYNQTPDSVEVGKSYDTLASTSGFRCFDTNGVQIAGPPLGFRTTIAGTTTGAGGPAAPGDAVILAKDVYVARTQLQGTVTAASETSISINEATIEGTCPLDATTVLTFDVTSNTFIGMCDAIPVVMSDVSIGERVCVVAVYTDGRARAVRIVTEGNVITFTKANIVGHAFVNDSTGAIAVRLFLSGVNLPTGEEVKTILVPESAAITFVNPGNSNQLAHPDNVAAAISDSGWKGDTKVRAKARYDSSIQELLDCELILWKSATP